MRPDQFPLRVADVVKTAGCFERSDYVGRYVLKTDGHGNGMWLNPDGTPHMAWFEIGSTWYTNDFKFRRLGRGSAKRPLLLLCEAHR